MTENKTSLSKEEFKKATEKQLLPRLKWIAYVLLAFSICAFTYAFMEDPSFISDSAAVSSIESEIEEFIENEMEEIPHFNSYIMATSFVTVGSACLFYVWKKKRGLNM